MMKTPTIRCRPPDGAVATVDVASDTATIAMGDSGILREIREAKVQREGASWMISSYQHALHAGTVRSPKPEIATATVVNARKTLLHLQGEEARVLRCGVDHLAETCGEKGERPRWEGPTEEQRG